MTALKKYFFILPGLIYYSGLLIYFLTSYPGRWINSICITAILLLVQIVVYLLSRRRSPLLYAFSFLIPTAFCISVVSSLAFRETMSFVWLVLSLVFAIALIIGSRKLRAVPRNTTAVWMGIFIILVEFSFLAGLLSVL